MPTTTRLARAVVHMVCACIGWQMAMYLQATGWSRDPPALLGYWAAVGTPDALSQSDSPIRNRIWCDGLTGPFTMDLGGCGDLGSGMATLRQPRGLAEQGTSLKRGEWARVRTHSPLRSGQAHEAEVPLQRYNDMNNQELTGSIKWTWKFIQEYQVNVFNPLGEKNLFSFFWNTCFQTLSSIHLCLHDKLHQRWFHLVSFPLIVKLLLFCKISHSVAVIL